MKLDAHFISFPVSFSKHLLSKFGLLLDLRGALSLGVSSGIVIGLKNIFGILEVEISACVDFEIKICILVIFLIVYIGIFWPPI